jgi:hypothetical protein
MLMTSLLVMASVLMLFSAPVQAETNYVFASQTVNKGGTIGAANRDAEDAIYEQMTEADQYANTNFTATTESVTIGTVGGGAFPGALASDDASRRSYTEANTAGGSPTYQNLRTTSDGSPLTMIPTPAVSHYLNLDETIVGGDGDTSYIEGVSNGQSDTYGMSDATDPGGSYNIDVIIWHISDDEGATSNLQVGLHIGAVYYVGWQGDLNSGVYTNYSYEWTTDPSDAGEWTLTDVNALQTYLTVTDANPDTRTTQLALRIEFNPVATYQLAATITYSSVTSTTYTTGYTVFCQAYRNGDTESIYVKAWNYITLGWDLKATISAGSDTDYNFDLTTQQRDGSANEVKFQLTDASGGDSTQTAVYFDVLKVMRIEVGYALDVEMTATGIPSYGAMTLRIKGYTSAESFGIQTWNATSASWDVDRITITALSNTWYQYALVEVDHVSGGQVKIKFIDKTAQTSDTTQDTCYLDVAWVTHYQVDPSMNLDGCNPFIAYKGTTIHFYVVVTDVDDQLPSSGYPKVNIEGSEYTMIENSSGDTHTYDSKAYYYDKSDFIQGEYDFHFVTKDATSNEITTTPEAFTIQNRDPEFTDVPANPINKYRNVAFWFDVNAIDQDADTFVFECWDEDSLIQASDTGILTGTTPDVPGSYTVNLWVNDSHSGSDFYTFELVVSNRVPVFIDVPTDPVHKDPSGSFWFDVNATDDDSDTLAFDDWNEDSLTIASDTGILTGTCPVTPGSYTVNLWVNDSYSGSDFYTFELIVDAPPENGPPSFTSSPITQWQHGQEYEYAAACEDPEEDPVEWALEGNCTSFLIITPAAFTATISGLVPSMGYWEIHISIDDSYNPLVWQNFTLSALNQGPHFTNVPENESYVNESYEYIPTVQDNNTDELTFGLEDSPSWLSVNATTGRINGTPTLNGSYPVHLWVSDGLMTGWVNFTIEIDLNDSNVMDLLTLIVGLVFGFGLIALSILDKRHGIWPTYTGLAWFVISVVALYPVGIGWMILGIGIGLIMWLEGAMEYASSRRQKT